MPLLARELVVLPTDVVALGTIAGFAGFCGSCTAFVPPALVLMAPVVAAFVLMSVFFRDQGCFALDPEHHAIAHDVDRFV